MSDRRSRPAALYGLPLAVLAVMGGLVLAANPGHYGSAAILVGSLTAVLGVILTIRLFRAAGISESGKNAHRRADPGRIQETEGEIEV